MNTSAGIFILVVVIIVLVSIFSLYNQLVSRRNQVKFAFGTVDVLLKKRHDLIPSLVNVAEAHAKHERELFEELASLRVQAEDTRHAIGREDARRLGAEVNLGERLNTLLAIVENYPELTAHVSFQNVQHALIDNEAQIAAARRFYNSAVNDYNNSIDMFPSSVMASLMSLSPKPYFEARANERYAPRVSSHIGHP
ncbi:MAG: LemA family protein [Deinococcota bacterium]